MYKIKHTELKDYIDNNEAIDASVGTTTLISLEDVDIVIARVVKNLNLDCVIKAEGDSVCLLNRTWHQCNTHNFRHEGCGNCKHFKQTDL